MAFCTAILFNSFMPILFKEDAFISSRYYFGGNLKKNR
ncbi:hypothetical protein Q648_01187 [Bartonella quintana JK 12]|uniref:Uncharacterized protein n=2 Tax=Bartonella quintana TaxID=803 RepID=W3U1N5_BARQI|nr:hypothetical protein Q651_00584 [Bartonella quintana BQ2-D70]ETS14939.1 hypothetical protein Q650_00327 [Bartonella quintana JK 73rel]ETS16779.1 hypothetical protein Q649_00336 [Bartonella quintana JK 73]ETS17026.1 hypothetical protein Q648_01187 [Bartonella quintana JK 12]ETS19321.1 hypothetical protein Q647_00330 [Bartonella quintana JK 7]KEC58636.1 hypothetical protein O93_00911 [Bartonella quintana JK 19]KEC61947.1 hypothetical protein O91_00565 [Bartonella quintana JK 31]KEC63210.1 h